jgi:ribosome-associated toxin RatA of RatAB toxin-antitoxin module
MKKATLEATAYAPVEDVYDFFMDFENYAKYSGYVERIRTVREGDYPEWAITFKWWIVRYTFRSQLLDYAEHEHIEWELTKDVDVRGKWRFEETTDEDGEPATDVELDLWYDPRSVSKMNPVPLFPTSRLIRIVKPVAARHINTVLQRVTQELEGEPREVNFILRYEDTGDFDEFLELVPDDNVEERYER